MSSLCVPLVAALTVVVAAGASQVKIHRPDAASWKRTQCGSPSGTHPAGERVVCVLRNSKSC